MPSLSCPPTYGPYCSVIHGPRNVLHEAGWQLRSVALAPSRHALCSGGHDRSASCLVQLLPHSCIQAFGERPAQVTVCPPHDLPSGRRRAQVLQWLSGCARRYAFPKTLNARECLLSTAFRLHGDFS